MTKPKLSEPIVSDYLRRIATGELQQGELLPTENVLVKDYAVSRTAVREALQALAAKGFIRIRQGSGSTVAPRWQWNVLDSEYLEITALGSSLMRDLLEARDMLEPAIAVLAARRADEGQIERLRKLHAELAEKSDAGPEVHAGIDIAFHGLLAECTGNPVVTSLHTSIAQLGQKQRSLMAGVPGAVARAIFWHEHILDAIENHNEGAAQDAMRMHLRQVHGEFDALAGELDAEPAAS